MAPLISSSLSTDIEDRQQQPHNGTLRPDGTVSPSLLQVTPHDRRKHKIQPSVTSIPVQDPAQDQYPFPDLPTAGDGLQLEDFPAYIIPAGLMSSAAVDGGLNLSFDDYMTPDQSTDNYISEHTTPQEAIWEREFQYLPTNGASLPHILDSSSQHSGHEEIPPKALQESYKSADSDQPKYISGADLLTPSPPGSAKPTPAQLVDLQDNDMGRLNKKRGADTLQLSTDARSLHPQPSRHGSISPVIMVSSHSHGDSPAHVTPPRHRSLSRPGQSPISGERVSYSRLRLPGPPDADSQDAASPRTGQDPTNRTLSEVATVNELAEIRQLNARHEQVENWLIKTESIADQVARRADRPRALSTGVRVDAMGLPKFSDASIPGPGVMIDEDSSDDYSDDSSYVEALASESSSEAPESPPVEEDDLNREVADRSYFPRFEDEEIPPEMLEPLPRQFYRRGPWQDPLTGPIHDQQWQPFSSNAAMVRYNEESAKWETASRAATWGTRRRLSDGEVQSIVDGSRVRHLSLVKRGRARGSTLIKLARDKANELIPRRSNSNIKRAAESSQYQEPLQLVESPQQRESISSIKPVQRISSFGKSRSSDIAAINTSVTSAQHGEATSADSQKIKAEGGLRSPLHLLRKARSKSDVGNRSSAKSSPGLHELMAQHGGPPVMSMASPKADPVAEFPGLTLAKDTALEDDDDDEGEDDFTQSGIKMDLSVRAENIIPNFEGFKYHAKQLNPRLQPYLIDRIGHEQIRRYKKLLDSRVKHKKAVLGRSCTSKDFCYDLGGEAKLLTPRPSNKDPSTAVAQFSVHGHGEADVDEEMDEGVVTPALFPPGIPLPPVKRLPAEFECFLCFKVKKFQKPSDWTKHVHEDAQPFSCTFPNCNDGKSFKRKADWVRHENERHRRLESWRCNVPECSHVCYRKDNFVQHLVREHKKNEPNNKDKPNAKSRGRQEDHEVWQLVDACRQESTIRPQDEPCKFCGNKLSSWKKLSVHMGKHMEQIAMPVLDLIKLKDVTADTIISPIEQQDLLGAGSKKGPGKSGNPQMYLGQGIPLEQFGSTQMATASPLLATQHDPSLSPYARSVHSHHITSGTQSPAMMQASPHMNHMGYDKSAYYANAGVNGAHGHIDQSEAFENAHGYAQASFTNATSHPGHYAQVNTQLGSTYSPAQQAMSTPMSAHSMTMMMGPSSATSYAHPDAQYGQTADMAPFQNYSAASQAASYNITVADQHSYVMHDEYAQQQQDQHQQQNVYHNHY
jgi:hypothetical protein